MKEAMSVFMFILVISAMSVRIRKNYKMREFEKTQEKIRENRKMRILEEGDTTT